METTTIIGVGVVAILAFTNHEAAHAFAADRCGDPTPRAMGRVTLNPIPHIHPIFTLAIPLVLILSGAPFIFGGARPVSFMPHNFRKPQRDFALVAAVGPLSNLLMAFLCAGLLSVLIHTGAFVEASLGTTILAFGVYVNALLFVFNLIPIPPLDGSKIVLPYLKGQGLEVYRQLEKYGFFILLALLMVPSLGFGHLLWFGITELTLLISDVMGVQGPTVKGLGRFLSG